MERIVERRITAEEDGRLLRDILRHGMGISAKLLSRIKQMPDGIMLNGERVFVNVRVSAGDFLRVVLEKDDSQCMLIPQPGEVDIRYEDEDFLVINKPAGMPVQPAIGSNIGSLGNIVVWHYAERGERMVFRPVNRLDSGTSGVMVVAKNSRAHSALVEKLHTGEFEREYLAVVHGVPDENGTVDAPIERQDGSVIKRCVRPDGKPAVTHYRVESSSDEFSLVRLKLESGRTHQIRVHMSYIGHSLVGDFLYGKEEPELISRCALHSERLSFKHPFCEKTIFVQAELPQDMQNLIQKKIKTEK